MRERLQRSTSKLSGVMDMFIILILVMGLCVCTYVITCEIVYFKYVEFFKENDI